MSALIALILATILGGLAGPGAVERSIKQQLRQQLKGAQLVRVEVHRGRRLPPSRTISSIEVELAGFRLSQPPASDLRFEPDPHAAAGKIGRIRLRARDFEVADLPIQQLEVDITRLRYDLWKALLKRELRLIGFDSCTGSVRFTEAGLNHFLRPRVTALDDFRLRFLAGRIQVTGRARTALRLSVPVRLRAKLEPSPQGTINLVEPALQITFLPVPGFITRRILAQVNPRPGAAAPGGRPGARHSGRPHS